MSNRTCESASCCGRTCFSFWPILLIGLLAGFGFLAWNAQDSKEGGTEPAAPVPAASEASTRDATGIAWHRSLDEVSDASSGDAKLRFVLFTADSCAPCRMLKRDTLADQRVISLLDRDYACVKIDLTTQEKNSAATARKYGVNAIPAIRLIDAEGNAVSGWNGYVSADELLRRLELKPQAGKALG